MVNEPPLFFFLETIFQVEKVQVKTLRGVVNRIIDKHCDLKNFPGNKQ